MRTEEKYISLLTDFGFKRIFGQEVNKDLLIDFLNSLFEGEQVITDLQYLNGENLPDSAIERKAIFDIYCMNERGERFIVEMQNATESFMKDRTIYYSTFPIREQAERGEEWNYKLSPIYVVAIVNFDMREPSFNPQTIKHSISLRDDDTLRQFSNKVNFKYVEVSKFNKTEDQLETLSDKWLFALKNMSRLDRVPSSLSSQVFQKLFEQARIAAFTPAEFNEYEGSLKVYRDLHNSINCAKEEGKAEGLAQGKAEGLAEGMEKGIAQANITNAKNFLACGVDPETVAQCTGLPLDEVLKLLPK